MKFVASTSFKVTLLFIFSLAVAFVSALFVCNLYRRLEKFLLAFCIANGEQAVYVGISVNHLTNWSHTLTVYRFIFGFDLHVDASNLNIGCYFTQCHCKLQECYGDSTKNHAIEFAMIFHDNDNTPRNSCHAYILTEAPNFVLLLIRSCSFSFPPFLPFSLSLFHFILFSTLNGRL